MHWFFRFLAFLVALLVIIFALNNRQGVSISLWPLDFVAILPLYLVGFFFGLVGIVCGLLVAWRSGAAGRAERRRLKQELRKHVTAPAQQENP